MSKKLKEDKMKEKANASRLFQRKEGTLGDKQKVICQILRDMKNKQRKLEILNMYRVDERLAL